MKYFIVAGEASGDLHASGLMKSLKAIDKEADFRFFGGELMQAVGGKLVKHYRELAYMGFIPVLLHLHTILRNMVFCKSEIAAYSPDCVILVDYPGFNLQIARYIRKHLNIPAVYYISPTVWAWKKGRIKAINKYIDKMLCILPFEPDFYKKNGYDKAEYVGNPTVDTIKEREFAAESFDKFTKAFSLSDKPVIALLAGSRRQEIKDNLPAMLRAASTFNDYQLVIAGAPSIDVEFYAQFIHGYNVQIIYNNTYRLLQQAQAALVTSGTATLETALLRVPQAVCYKTPLKHIAAFIWKHFFKVKFISLVNLITEREIVCELFNERFSVENIRTELNRLLNDEEYKKFIQSGYDKIATKLNTPCVSDRAAKLIIDVSLHYKRLYAIFKEQP
ncbi:MAG: lipid-A-disaccharide synthase [Dysgonamonadaceae bacterium]|jgi:lipid-A-disaccharide synthase|nr:lipid-A-disaccharide synthase [Dysgonamonadaceae bacterium]